MYGMSCPGARRINRESSQSEDELCAAGEGQTKAWMLSLLLQQPREAQLGCNTTSSVTSWCWIGPAAAQSNIQALWMANRIADRPQQSGNANVTLGLHFSCLEFSEVLKCLMSWPGCASADTKHQRQPDLCHSQTDRYRIQSSTAGINTAPTPRVMNIYHSQLLLPILACFTFLNREETCLFRSLWWLRHSTF